jgi:O-antigen ligase
MRRVLGSIGCLLLAVPVAASVIGDTVPSNLRWLAVLLLLVTLARPLGGLLCVALLLPLSAYLALVTDRILDTGAVAELLVTAFLLASCARGLASAAPRLRMTGPATALGTVIAASSVIGLAAEQQVTAWPGAFLRALLDHLAHSYYSDAGSFRPLHVAVPWLEALVLAVAAERVLRNHPRARLVVMAALLAGVSTGAIFSWRRLVEVSLARPHPLEAAVGFLRSLRVSGLYPDSNAAGSLFALCLAPALWIGLRTRRLWSWAMVVVLGLAAWLTHSRAALGGVFLGVAIVWLATRRLTRLQIAAAAAATLAALLVVGSLAPTQAAQSSSGDSMVVRLRMARIAVQIARERPWFGVGLGQFQRESQAYITPEFMALFPQTRFGENAHNNFLQVLAELGVIGLTGFVWTLARPLAAAFQSVATVDREPVLAMTAGLLAFLATCLLGHPLLIAEVLAIFFLALGMTAGMTPTPGQASAAARWTLIGLLAVVFVSVPVRLWQLRHDTDLDRVVIGASRVVGTEDDVEFRLAEAESEWFVSAKARFVEIPVRLTKESQPPCLVRVDVDGRAANAIAPVRDTWARLSMQFQPTDKDPLSRKVRLHVDGASCHLMVGAFAVRQ